MHAGDYVQAGDPLVDGPLVPHDILRISGDEAVQHYLVREVQTVYRSQRVDIDDKHIEIIVSQMLRKVKVETMGDTGLLPGSSSTSSPSARSTRAAQVREDQGQGRQRLRGRQDRPQGSASRRVNAQLEALGGEPAKGVKPKPATASTQLLGITKAAVQISQLHLGGQLPGNDQGADRSGPGRQGRLPGGSEGELILGHLVPAGTGFRTPRGGGAHPTEGAVSIGYNVLALDGRRESGVIDEVGRVGHTGTHLKTTSKNSPH